MCNLNTLIRPNVKSKHNMNLRLQLEKHSSPVYRPPLPPFFPLSTSYAGLKISGLDQLMTDFPLFWCPALVFGQWTLAPSLSPLLLPQNPLLSSPLLPFPPLSSPPLTSACPRLTVSLCSHALVLSTKSVWKHNICKKKYVEIKWICICEIFMFDIANKWICLDYMRSK